MSLHKLAEAKGALLVLCCLSSNGGATTTYRLVRSVKLGHHAVEHSVRVLEELGLCENRSSGTFPFARTIRLTRRGRALLETPVGELPAFFWSNRQHEVRGWAAPARGLPTANSDPVREREGKMVVAS